MSGATDLRQLLATMEPELLPGDYVVCSLPGARYGDHAQLQPFACVIEPEGLTLVLPRASAEQAALEHHGVFRRVTLRVHSSLQAVGLTAAVAARLAARGIGANVLAGYYHDHILVPSDRAEDALRSLRELQRDAGAAS